MKILARRKEGEDPKGFKEVKNWLLLTCEDFPADLEGKSKTRQNKIKKYLSLLNNKYTWIKRFSK